jgi:hypothetical protein
MRSVATRRCPPAAAADSRRRRRRHASISTAVPPGKAKVLCPRQPGLASQPEREHPSEPARCATLAIVRSLPANDRRRRWLSCAAEPAEPGLPGIADGGHVAHDRRPRSARPACCCLRRASLSRPARPVRPFCADLRSVRPSALRRGTAPAGRGPYHHRLPRPVRARVRGSRRLGDQPWRPDPLVSMAGRPQPGRDARAGAALAKWISGSAPDLRTLPEELWQIGVA